MNEQLLDAVQAMIDRHPVHPLYDIVLDREGSGTLSYEIVLGWRAAVRWNQETLHEKYAEWKARWLTTPAPLVPEIERPVFGNNVAIAAMMFMAHPEDMWASAVRMIDRNFVDTISKTNLDALGMRFEMDRWAQVAAKPLR